MLIREPVDAVLELVIAKPALTVGGALRGYIRFAERLLPMRHRLAVGQFPVVTTDFARVIRAVNHRFGRGFAEFDHTDANVRRCFAEMDRYWASRGADRLTIERRVGRPSALRDRYKESLRAIYQRPELGRLRSHAENLYHAFDTDPLAQGSTDQPPRGADTPSAHRHTD